MPSSVTSLVGLERNWRLGTGVVVFVAVLPSLRRPTVLRSGAFGPECRRRRRRRFGPIFAVRSPFGRQSAVNFEQPLN